jgi:transposase
MSMNTETAGRLYNSGKAATIAKLVMLDAQVESLSAKVKVLSEKVAKLSKNSSNSSKPPSSDIVNPQAANRAERRRQHKGKRKKGGQPGHPKWERMPFSSDEVDPIEYTLESCPVCSGQLEKLPDEEPKIMQQVELANPPVKKIEHRANAYWCAKCNQIHYARIPEQAVKEGLFRPDMSALVCFLKYVGCMSLSEIKKYLKDAMNIPVTKGYLAKVIRKSSHALDAGYEELLQALPKQNIVNSDETGHKENGGKFWTWVFRANLFVLFKISHSRGSEVLIDVLGKEFNGVLGCDYFSAYRKFMTDFDVRIQFCLAHLIRDIKFLVDYPDSAVKKYGTGLLDAIRELFHTIHLRDTMSRKQFKAKLEACKSAILKIGTTNVPSEKVAQNMLKRLLSNGESYFTFITTPQIDPTNNCAEQAIRFVVIYRRVSQGTRSENGRLACERFFTVIATCARQGRSAFEFIKESIENYCKGLPGPSLLPVASTP